MDQEQALSLLNRQLIDIQANAEKIISGENSAEAIEAFARYSIELKKFITERIENEQIVAAAKILPHIKYQRTKIQFWQYLILPIWWINIYKDDLAKKQTQEEITHLRGKFCSLQMMVKNVKLGQ